jgi:hypothetical protein
MVQWFWLVFYSYLNPGRFELKHYYVKRVLFFIHMNHAIVKKISFFIQINLCNDKISNLLIILMLDEAVSTRFWAMGRSRKITKPIIRQRIINHGAYAKTSFERWACPIRVCQIIYHDLFYWTRREGKWSFWALGMYRYKQNLTQET